MLLARICSFRPNLCRHRSKVGPSRPNLIEAPKFGLIRVIFGPTRPKFDRHRRKVAEIDQVWPNSAQTWSNAANIGRNLADFSQIWPKPVENCIMGPVKLGRINFAGFCPDFADIGPNWRNQRPNHCRTHQVATGRLTFGSSFCSHSLIPRPTAGTLTLSLASHQAGPCTTSDVAPRIGQRELPKGGQDEGSSAKRSGHGQQPPAAILVAPLPPQGATTNSTGATRCVRSSSFRPKFTAHGPN